MKTLIRNIGKLVGIVPEGTLRKEGPEMGKVGSLDNAWLLIDGEKIDSFGQEGDSRYSLCRLPLRRIQGQDRRTDIRTDSSPGRRHPELCRPAPQDV